MAIDFPSSPTLNQTFTSGNVNYVWDGTKWTAAVVGGIALDKIEEGNTSVEVVDTGSDGRFVVNTEGAERLRIDSSGRLGLGTATPSDVLHVVGTIRTSSGGNNAQFANNYLRANGAGTFYIDHNTGGESLQFRVSNVTNLDTTALTITSAGRVGVGTATVNADLHLHNASANATFAINNGTVGSALTDGLTLISATDGSAFIAQRENADLILSTNNTERCRLDSNGRLLVGTASTSRYTRLSVTGNSAGSSNEHGVADLQFSGTAPGDGWALGHLNFADTSAGTAARIAAERDGGTWTSGSSMPGRLVFSTTPDGLSSPTERLRITSAGNTHQFQYFRHFNLGWSSTSYKYTGLDQNGAYVVFNEGNTGVYLTSAGNSWTGTSDERLKTDLVPIEDGLSKVATLRAVTGRFISDEVGVSRSFLIAQDVQQVLPEAVDAKDPEKLGLSYTDVIPLLVSALKDAKERIETLEAEVAALKAP